MATADVAVTAPPSGSSRPPVAEGPGRRRRPVTKVLWVLVVGLLVLLLLYPFVWLVSASLKPRSEVFDNGLIPNPLQASNYSEVWQTTSLLTWLVNSVVVGVAAAVAVTISSALVAFGFAYFRFRGRNTLFALVLGTMMLPGTVTMVPTYLIWNEIGLASTQVPLWAGNLFASAFYVFMLRQFFLTVPRDLFEAARIDGANHWRLFRSIALPLARPALIIVLVFELRASWTDLVKPLIYLRDPALYTVPRGLKSVVDQFGKGGESQWEIVLAASVLATIPMVVLFLLAQRHFVQGIATTGRGGS
ncbi:carbohydrate ABC transporter permease [Angustibacter aerolatus]